MKHISRKLHWLAAVLFGFAATTQAQVTIFNETFDPKLPAAAVQLGYEFGDASGSTAAIVPGAGMGGTAGLQIVLNAASGASGFAGAGGQYQLTPVAGNSLNLPGDYTLSFDAKATSGSMRLGYQMWTGPGFGNPMCVDLATSTDLTFSTLFTHFAINLGTLTGPISGVGMTGRTIQLNFQVNGGGPTPYAHTVVLDNIQLTMAVPEPSTIALSGLGAAAGLFGFLRRRRA